MTCLRSDIETTRFRGRAALQTSWPRIFVGSKAAGSLCKDCRLRAHSPADRARQSSRPRRRCSRPGRSTPSAEPDVVTNGHGLRSLESASSRARIERMQRGVDLNPRPDLNVAADPNGIAVQEDTTVIEEPSWPTRRFHPQSQLKSDLICVNSPMLPSSARNTVRRSSTSSFGIAFNRDLTCARAA